MNVRRHNAHPSRAKRRHTFPSVVASALAGEESEGSMAGVLELAMAHRGELCAERERSERGRRRRETKGKAQKTLASDLGFLCSHFVRTKKP
jgi:hypothetical protein